MRARAATSSASLLPVGWRAARRRPARLRARGAPRSLSRDASSRSSLLALLAHGAALELELDVPELDDVVLLHLLVVHEGAVRAVEVGDLELPALVAEGGVLAGDLLVGEDDVAVGRGAPSAHHRLLHLQAVGAGVPARMHDVAVGADLAFLFVLLEERQDPVEKLQEHSFPPQAGW